jgi:hypothetical protein
LIARSLNNARSFSPRLSRHQPRRLEHHLNHFLIRLRMRVVELGLDRQLGPIRPQRLDVDRDAGSPATPSSDAP